MNLPFLLCSPRGTRCCFSGPRGLASAGLSTWAGSAPRCPGLGPRPCGRRIVRQEEVSSEAQLSWRRACSSSRGKRLVKYWTKLSGMEPSPHSLWEFPVVLLEGRTREPGLSRSRPQASPPSRPSKPWNTPCSSQHEAGLAPTSLYDRNLLRSVGEGVGTAVPAEASLRPPGAPESGLYLSAAPRCACASHSGPPRSLPLERCHQGPLLRLLFSSQSLTS